MTKSKITMSKIIYRRCSLTLDPATIRKSKELAVSKGQSVSALVRWLVGQAYERAEVVSPERIERMARGIRRPV